MGIIKIKMPATMAAIGAIWVVVKAIFRSPEKVVASPEKF
jgi:hypothetical protein